MSIDWPKVIAYGDSPNVGSLGDLIGVGWAMLNRLATRMIGAITSIVSTAKYFVRMIGSY